MYHLQPLPGFFTLSRTFFITILPTAFYDRSRMTGRYLVSFRKKLFFVSSHTCPFRQPVGWHFPRQAGTAFILYSFFYALIYQLLLFKNTNSFSSVVRCPPFQRLVFPVSSLISKQNCLKFPALTLTDFRSLRFIKFILSLFVTIKTVFFSASFPFSKVLIEISSQNHFCML